MTLDPTPFGTRVSLSHGPWDPNWDACGYALGWWCRLLNLRGICEEPPWPVRPDRAVQPTPENGIG